MSDDTPDRAWLLLLFHLPTRPTSARVRTWRRLQHLGALPVRHSGYALPRSDAAREDFEWLRADIVAAGGDATIFVADAVDPAADAALRSEAVLARRRDFAALAKDAAALARKRRTTSRARHLRDVRSLSARMAHLDSIDVFGAGRGHPARAAIQAVLDGLQETIMTVTDTPTLRTADFRRRIWVTRPRPGIDRFASAWLIQKFIDPDATFGFADSVEAAQARRGRPVPFDMYGAEFGHQDGGCSFETLVRRFAIRAPGIDWLARLVHALDLKADLTEMPEAVAIGRLVDGLRVLHADDAVLLTRGIELIDALHTSRPDPADQTAPPVRRSRRRGTAKR